MNSTLFILTILANSGLSRTHKISISAILRTKMQQAMIRCNGVQTQVLTEHRWVEEGLDPNGGKDLVLVIPGNPGIPSFYEDFVKAIKSKLPSETPVWVVGHAGHVQPPGDLWYSPDDRKAANKYSLDGQLRHKVTKFKKKLFCLKIFKIGP